MVIAILAVLAATAVVAYSNISSQAKDAQNYHNCNALARGLNTYNSLVDDNFRITDRYVPWAFLSLDPRFGNPSPKYRQIIQFLAGLRITDDPDDPDIWDKHLANISTGVAFGQLDLDLGILIDEEACADVFWYGKKTIEYQIQLVGSYYKGMWIVVNR